MEPLPPPGPPLPVGPPGWRRRRRRVRRCRWDPLGWRHRRPRVRRCRWDRRDGRRRRWPRCPAFRHGSARRRFGRHRLGRRTGGLGGDRRFGCFAWFSVRCLSLLPQPTARKSAAVPLKSAIAVLASDLIRPSLSIVRPALYPGCAGAKRKSSFFPCTVPRGAPVAASNFSRPAPRQLRGRPRRPVGFAEHQTAVEPGDDPRPGVPRIVVDGHGVGQRNGVGDDGPQAAVTLADLVLGNGVPTRGDAVRDTLHGKVFRDRPGHARRRCSRGRGHRGSGRVWMGARTRSPR